MEIANEASAILQSLPEALKTIHLRHLLAVRLESVKPTVVGRTPAHDRRIGFITGGTFESNHDGLNGAVADGGNDWQTVRDDGTTTLSVRIVLETVAGEVIAMTYSGFRHGPPDVLERLARGDVVDPAEYYFRTAPTFETAAPRFAWLNRIVTIGTGHRFPTYVVYNIFEVL